MNEIRIDVRDLDYTWFENIKAYMDQEASRYYLPKESADRLGEPDEASNDYVLFDGHVKAQAVAIEIGDQRVDTWVVKVTDIPTRPTLRAI